jgi:hypothetical protein
LDGIASGLNYYKASIQSIDLEDTVNLSGWHSYHDAITIRILTSLHPDFPDDWTIEQPYFFAAAHNDALCTPVRFQPMIEKYAMDLVTIDCSAGHWLQFEASDQLNNELENWLREKLSLS